jgi:CRP-like cAMP-binding protein
MSSAMSSAPAMSRPATTSASSQGDLVHRYASWVACCLSRGRRAPLNPHDLTQLIDELSERRVAGGTYVFRQGDDAARVHIVRSGRVELSRTVGRRHVTLQELRAGDVFGDVPALLGEPEPFDARAIEDTVILTLEVPALLGLLQTRPLVAQRWFISLAERMATMQQRLIGLLAGGLEAQVADLLLREAGVGDTVSITQSRLADLLGSQRSSVQRVLKNLEAAGVIESRYRKITIVDAVGLSALVDGTSDTATG